MARRLTSPGLEWGRLPVMLAIAIPLLAAAGPPPVVINEIRIDEPGADENEYFELKGPPGTSLDGLCYVVIGDHPELFDGAVEEITVLDGYTIPEDGIFLAAEDTIVLGQPSDLIKSVTMHFENSDNVTHMLVLGLDLDKDVDDLDLDDDCTLDDFPWEAVVDLVALIEEENPPSGTECHYGRPVVGPPLPGHVYRCGDGWRVGAFEAGVDDTPGTENCPGDVDIDCTVGVGDLIQVITQWGACPVCAADLNRDGTVDVLDLILLIGNWGPC